MSMAGFSPGDLFSRDPEFFARWVAQGSLEAAYADPLHPNPEQRAAFLRSQLAAVIDDLEFFDFGVRLAELGRFEDAILLLKRFQDSYAGREVLSNLGYAEYQLGLRALSLCDESAATRFRLPVAIDEETLASGSRLRGTAEACLASPPVRKPFAEAKRYLDLALEKDPGYLPARRNLLALEIVSGRAAAALSLADDTLALFPGDASTLIAKGIALHQFGIESRLETVDAALALLKEAETDPRRAADAIYNQAVILSQRPRTAGALDNWKRFLQVEPTGQYSDAVRERLGLPVQVAAPAKPIGTSPIPLGKVGPETSKALAGLESRAFFIGDLAVRFYRSPQLRALQLGDAIEVVETKCDLRPQFPSSERPPQRVELLQGVVLRFPSFALRMAGDRAESILYFVPAN